MGLILFAAFVGVPILEIAVFMNVGAQIGVWPTLGLVVLTAVAGSYLLRIQGLSTMARAQEAAQRGETPLTELMEGVYLLIAGVLLLTPGFVTDAVGLLFFIPAVRRGLGVMLLRAIAKRGSFTVSGSAGFSSHPDHGHAGPGNAGMGQDGGPIIDGEFQEVRPKPDQPDKKLSGPSKSDDDEPQSVVGR